MTAADRAKAAELLSLGATPAHTGGARDAIAAALAAARADADARWTAAVEGLAEEWERDARPTRCLDLNAAADRLRGLTTSSEEE